MHRHLKLSGVSLGTKLSVVGVLAAMLGTVPTWVVVGQASGENLGSAVALDDFTGDGFGEVVAVARAANIGEVRVFYGSATGTESAPGLRLFSPSGSSNNLFGRTVASAGDWNGDGLRDLLITDPSENRTGSLWIYPGTPSGLSPTPTWQASGDAASCCAYGSSAASVGDVNGDGFSDVIVGNSNFNGGAGRVYLYLGTGSEASSDPIWTLDGEQPTQGLGIAVAGAGDIDNDGYADIILGDPGWSNPKRSGGGGRVMVFLGSPDGPATTPDWTATSMADAAFGSRVSSAGDVNKDGYADILVGAPYADVGRKVGSTSTGTNRGRVYVYLGSAAGLPKSADWTAVGDQDSAQLGDSLTGIADADGDSYDDVIVVAPHRSEQVVDQGRVYLYRGGPKGLGAQPAWIVDAPAQANIGNIGIPVASGNANGDGLGDMLLGFPRFQSSGNLNAGRAELYVGQ